MTECEQCGARLTFVGADPRAVKIQMARTRFCPKCANDRHNLARRQSRAKASQQTAHIAEWRAGAAGRSDAERIRDAALRYCADPTAEARICARHGTPDPAMVVYRNGPWACECVAHKSRRPS